MSKRTGLTAEVEGQFALLRFLFDEGRKWGAYQMRGAPEVGMPVLATVDEFERVYGLAREGWERGEISGKDALDALKQLSDAFLASRWVERSRLRATLLRWRETGELDRLAGEFERNSVGSFK